MVHKPKSLALEIRGAFVEMMPSAFGKFGDIVNGCFFGTQPLNQIHVYKCQFATAFYLFYDGRDGNDIAVKNEDDLAVTVQTAGKSCIIF